METHRIETRFGPVDVRVYRLREGWWPVPVGRHGLPSAPVLDDARLPQTVGDAVRRMAEAIDALPPRPAPGTGTRSPRVDLSAPLQQATSRPDRRLRQLACGDVVPGCTRVFRGTKEDILRDVAAHAAVDHGMAVVPDHVVARVLAAMTPVD